MDREDEKFQPNQQEQDGIEDLVHEFQEYVNVVPRELSHREGAAVVADEQACNHNGDRRRKVLGVREGKEPHRKGESEQDFEMIVVNLPEHPVGHQADHQAQHLRLQIHFTPTSASWLNIVERLFRDITENRIRRGTFRSVHELEKAIAEYKTHHNANPKPFIWTATHHDILGRVARAKAAMMGSAI